jgi:hypothetical protein
MLSARSPEGSQPVSVTTPFGQATSTAGSSSARPSTPSTRKSSRNDLKEGRFTRSLQAGRARLTVKYSLQSRVQHWAPGVDRLPLRDARRVGGGAWSVLVVPLLLGSFHAPTDWVLPALATQSEPEESLASGITAVQTMVALTRFACSLGFGLLWQLTGRQTALWIMAAALTVSFAMEAAVLRSLLRSNSGGLS